MGGVSVCKNTAIITYGVAGPTVRQVSTCDKQGGSGSVDATREDRSVGDDQARLRVTLLGTFEVWRGGTAIR
jgi:hypothetical protein